VYCSQTQKIYYFILIILAYRKHQHNDHTHKAVHIVYAATKQTNSTCYDYSRFTDCVLSFKNYHTNILIC
jgi:hypothetical protein